MDEKQFILLVEEMREWQKNYFKTRTQKALKKSINLEAQVDKAVGGYYDCGKISPEDSFDLDHPDLFDQDLQGE